MAQIETQPHDQLQDTSARRKDHGPRILQSDYAQGLPKPQTTHWGWGRQQPRGRGAV